MIRCVVFDFDGVLVDSNHIKYQAYFDVFPADIPGLHDSIRRVHALGIHPDRFGIIREVLASASGPVGPRDLDLDSRVAWFAHRYGAITEDAVSVCAEVDGASAALSSLGAVLPLYLNSATPEEALRRIIDRRGWSRHFRDVMGRPRSKAQNLELVMLRERVSAQETLFVGDGRQDVDAAREIGCHFVGVRNASNDFPTNGLHMIDDLSTLPDLVGGLQN